MAIKRMDHVGEPDPVSVQIAGFDPAMLAEALRKEPDDLRALALHFERSVEREIVPWYELQRQQDRDAIEVDAIQRRGENPFQIERADGSQDPKAFMRSLLREGLGHALRDDIQRHRDEAAAAGITGRTVEVPTLALDIDTADDLAAVETALQERHGGAAHTRGMLRQLSRSQG